MAQAPISYKDPAWDTAEEAAAKRTGVPKEVLAAIRTQGEKSNGDQTSPKGAKGVYQFMPKTERLFFEKYGVSAYSNDPVEQATAAAYHLKESYSRTKDWGLAAAGYNGGMTGEKNPRFTKETSDYYDRVTAALPEGIRTRIPGLGKPQRAMALNEESGVPLAQPVSWEDAWAGRAPDFATVSNDSGAPRRATSAVGTAAPFAPNFPVEASPLVPLAQATQAAQEAKEAKRQEQERWGRNDRNTTMGASLSMALTPSANAIAHVYAIGELRDEAYIARRKADPLAVYSYVENPTQDEKDLLASTQSDTDLALALTKINTDREDRGVMANVSGTEQFLMGTLGTLADPVGWAAGFGAMKGFQVAGIGATALMAAGRPMVAGASLLAENAIGNVLSEAGLQALGEHRSIDDYAMSALAGAAMSVPFLPGTVRAAHNSAVLKAAQEAYTRQAPFFEQAGIELGAAATPETIRERAAVLEAEAHTVEAQKRLAAPGPGRKLDAPDTETMLAREAEEQAPKEPEPIPEAAPTPAPPSAPEATPEPAPKPEVLRSHRGDRLLTMDEAKAEYKIKGDFTPGAVALSPGLESQPAWVQAQQVAQALIDRYVPGESVLLQAPSKGMANSNGVGGAALQTASGHVIAMKNPANLSTLIHEVGHVVYNKLAERLPPELHGRMKAAVAQWGADFDASAARGMRARLGVSTLHGIDKDSALTKVAEGRLTLDGLNDAVRAGGRSPAKFMDYFRSVDEFGAEQLVKHTEDMVAQGKLGREGPLKVIADMIRSLLDLFKRAKAEGHLKPDASWAEFFERAASGEFRDAGPQGMIDVESPGFNKWFGDSKIVDADGKPLPLYHGTKYVAGAIDTLRADPNGLIFASTDPAFAEDYAVRAMGGGQVTESGPVYKVFAKAEKPFDPLDGNSRDMLYERLGYSDAGAAGTDQGMLGAESWALLEQPHVVQAIRELGYDGIWLTEGGTRNLAVFDPSQFKSAVGNTGDFSGPNIHEMNAPTVLDPIDTKYGTDTMDTSDVAGRMRQKYIKKLRKDAEAWLEANPQDPARLKTLMDNKLFDFSTPGHVLAASDDPLAKMYAAMVVEDAMGAGGRHDTASIRKFMVSQSLIGSSVIDYDRELSAWATGQRGWARSAADALTKGELQDKFNKAVFTEIENRLHQRPSTKDGNVLQAADSVQGAMERMRLAQVDNKTAGWGALPTTSVGYLPHRFNAAALMALEPEAQRALVDVLRGQLIELNGFDEAFADRIAKVYVQHARTNANAGHEIPGNMHDPAAAHYVEEAMRAQGMTRDEIQQYANKLRAGAMSHTKKRLKLDLSAEYAPGKQMMELYHTDIPSLLKGQAERVGGEVALTQSGIMGSAGLKMIEDALSFKPAGMTPEAHKKMMEAFQQTAAEMLDRPWRNESGQVQWANRAMQANTLSSLGGMGFAQLQEGVNIGLTLGIGHAMRSLASVPQLIGEIKLMAKGAKVENSILHSMEQFGGGGEFGMADYKMALKLDDPSKVHTAVGQDGINMLDRGLRLGSRALSVVSFHRMTTAVQVRSAALEITSKALRYIKEGTDDKALADMGFTPEIRAAVKADIDKAVVWDGNSIKSFDITKITDTEAASAFVTAVHRGSRQIIQGSFVGEKHRWQHTMLGRMATQFRTFPLVAMEKQLGRNRATHGAAAVLGMVLAALPFVMAIQAGRVLLGAVGREDSDKYIDERMSPEALTRASLNYIGVLGLIPDVVNGLTTMLPDEVDQALGGAAGGRQGQKGLSAVVPIVGWGDKVVRAATNEGAKKVSPLLSVTPLNNTPLLAPLTNLLRDAAQ